MAGEAVISKDLFGKIGGYVNDVRAEMKRVTWPGKQEVYSTTVMVIITTFLFGIFFLVCDEAFRHLINFILTWGKSV